ncbi:MAG: electron transport complex subunit E [Endomicrobia bacterium]|nr:electron transport complex subunit E [Endomicrobiia bacterium]MDW8055250.1 electron transport complex subunit E [Elusimicrobiota bacterium]
MKQLLKIFFNGIVKENPVLIMMIGLCPFLACSTTANDAIGMGIAATFVLTCSNVIISLIRKIIPHNIRIPVFIVVIATFTTVVDYLIKAYFPALSESLGVFIPLIVVNCIILARAEAFASKNNVFYSLIDGIGMGAGFFVAIVILGIIREFLGSGTIFGSKEMLQVPAVIMILPPGGFLAAGVVITVVKYIENKIVRRTKVLSNLPSACEGCKLKSQCIQEKIV